MTATLKRMGLGIGATLIAVGLAGGAYVAAQNSTQPQGPTGGRAGRFGGPGGGFGRGRGGPGGPGGVLGPGFARLNLTDAQKQRVQEIVASHRDELRTAGQRAMAARTALQTATSAETFDEATVRTKAADAAAAEADMAVLRARVFAEVYQILTPDQQTQLKQFQTQMRQRAQDRAARGANPQK